MNCTLDNHCNMNCKYSYYNDLSAMHGTVSKIEDVIELKNGINTMIMENIYNGIQVDKQEFEVYIDTVKPTIRNLVSEWGVQISNYYKQEN